jgi:hypothetical protein
LINFSVFVLFVCGPASRRLLGDAHGQKLNNTTPAGRPFERTARRTAIDREEIVIDLRAKLAD